METAAGPEPERIPVVIVGAGQAGLAAGYCLARAGVPFVILDAGSRIGDAWRNRWASLRLFTPARIDGLPGMRFPAPPNALPTKDAMADYLEAYADHFKLPVRLGARVTALDAVDGHFALRVGERRIDADQVIVATGANQSPRIPAFASDLAPDIRQLSAAEYREPAQLQPGGALVVGAGNSGAEIALEIVGTHETWLSGRGVGVSSPAVFTPLMWWMALHILTPATPVGRRFEARRSSRGAPWLRIREEDLAAAGVQRVARTTGAKGGKPQLEDGQVPDVTNVVWCAGFGHDDRWIHLPIFDAAGAPLHQRGVVTAQPGLYVLGRPFLFGITSSLVGGAGRDAQFIASHIVKARGSHVPAQARG